jgi:hypothetical protein
LHQFDFTDRSIPEKTLAVGPPGAIYGMTSIGGADVFGTALRITLDREFSPIYSFEGGNASTGPTISPGADGGRQLPWCAGHQ